MWGAIASIGGGLLSAAGSIFGGSGSSSESKSQGAYADLNKDAAKFSSRAIGNYQAMYDQYYWPLEHVIAQNYISDYMLNRPYQQQMMQYQLDRGNELISLANETNPILDANKKDVIRRLTEGEDVLRDRYRSTASADVAASFANQRDQDYRQMNMMGINPNSGAYGNYISKTGTGEALAQAGARTNAAWEAEDVSLRRQMEANNWYTNPEMLYNLGRLEPGMSASSIMGIGSGGSGGSVGGYSSYNSSSGGDMWGGLGSGLTGVLGGLGDLFPMNSSSSGSSMGSMAGVTGSVSGIADSMQFDW